VNTDLFVLAHGMDAALLDRVVPPACRTKVERAGPPVSSDHEWVIDAGPWELRHPARHFVPALSLLSSSVAVFRTELSVWRDGAWSAWVAADPIGGDDFTTMFPNVPALACDVDVFTTPAPVDRVALRVRVRMPAARSTPWLATLSACDLAPLERAAHSARSVRIAVPARSQMVEREDIRRRICSPTSVAMVLEYCGRRIDTAVVAADVLHAATDRYGVWPAAVAAAARHGVAGYLLRFPDWASAAWCLAAGLPIVASVRYRADELPGAAMQETDGHLVVITGEDGDVVLLNDPAADTTADVPRRVPRAALERVWLERAGVGYVLFSVDG
jgi:hypothetical protein